MFSMPSVLLGGAKAPVAVLSSPLVLSRARLYPMAVLSLAVVLVRRAYSQWPC